MVQNTIEALLRQKLGLDANSVGSRIIERAVEQRQIACQLPDRVAYLALVQSSPQELNQLIEAVVVPETWFFRDREPFQYLRQFVQEKYVKEKYENVQFGVKSIDPDAVLHILSVPCSTGEEPYSIAMTLLDSGLTPAQFRIDAVDVSQQALIKARAGIYRKKSFRGGAIQNLEHYFQVRPEGFAEGYEVRPIVRESVNFIQGNVLEPRFLLGKQYHAIFCRNLLIYLDEAARHQVIESLDRALLPLGLLFLGSAETGQMANRNYQSIDHPFAFAYQKVFLPNLQTTSGTTFRTTSRTALDADAAPPNATAAALLKRKESTKANYSKLRLSSPWLKQTAVQSPAQSRDSGNSSSAPKSTLAKLNPVNPRPAFVQPFPAPLETARQLADRGQLTQAAQLCESYVRANSAQPIAYLLLGEIYQGLNQPKQAERCFQKAIYLNPNAYEALVHLALLKEQQGNWVEAQRLKRRAQRLAEQGYEQSQSGS
ncbi:protein-glutamate O-methyltransferase CheR [Leptolyngbya sp. FACHB-711]|uniref:CheR family methyltransferase n=1 Tax=Leptolyngbya sp. FACHB-711 TaxID=2692813 RepID=UPI00168220DA|nr:protein-glutamate O-methyltransferase CheR [Leptolyngbya sp. FACHB-711]MBD2027023.1 tetratricopeptide repeat protein [Leptolyngbya sp. FACHB-711]